MTFSRLTWDVSHSVRATRSTVQNTADLPWNDHADVYGDSTCGQRALYALGMTQIPIVCHRGSGRSLEEADHESLQVNVNK